MLEHRKILRTINNEDENVVGGQPRDEHRGTERLELVVDQLLFIDILGIDTSFFDDVHLLG